MMHRRVGAAALVVAFALSASSGVVVAHEEMDVAEDGSPARTITGTVSEVEGTWYVTPDDGEPVALSFGPSWFDDLEALFGVADGDTGVIFGGTLIGDVTEDGEPLFRVQAVDGKRRAQGKPPWAGGPKVVGDTHPGYEAWLEEQAQELAADADDEASTHDLVRVAQPGGGDHRVPLTDE